MLGRRRLFRHVRRFRCWVAFGLLGFYLPQSLSFIPPEQVSALPDTVRNHYVLSEELVREENFSAATHHVDAMISQWAQPEPVDIEAILQLYDYAGDVYLKAGDLESALRHFDKAVTAYEGESFSAELVMPLQGLAVTYMRLGMVDEAEQMLLRAQNIMHRHQGVYSLEQLKVLEELTALKDQTVPEYKLDALYRYHLRIHESAFGRHDSRSVSSMLRLAEYLGERAVNLRYRPNGYKRRVFRQNSHELFERAIEVLKTEYGPHSPRLLQPIRDYASMLYRHRGRYDRSMAGKRRSVELIREVEQIIAAQPDVTQADLAAARVAVADLYVIWGKGGALQIYREAWDMIGDDPQFDVVRQELFGEPVRLTNRTLSEKPEYVRAPPLMANGEPLFSEIAFKVAANGRVRKTETVGGNVPFWRTFRLKEKLEGAKYRPRFVDGEPVATEGLVHVQPYRVGLASWYRR